MAVEETCDEDAEARVARLGVGGDERGEGEAVRLAPLARRALTAGEGSRRRRLVLEPPLDAVVTQVVPAVGVAVVGPLAVGIVVGDSVPRRLVL